MSGKQRTPQQSLDSEVQLNEAASMGASMGAPAAGGLGNGFMQEMMGGAAGAIGAFPMPGIPLPRLPSFPTPEFPIPGMPEIPSPQLPEIGLPQLPSFGDLIPDEVGEGMDTMSQIWEREGANALLDPVGALDRHNARDELASRFEVVGDDFVGPRNHNQVSAEEYDRIVQTYSDIRLGRGDLTIDTSEMTDDNQESTYRQGVMDQIGDMMETTSGRNMIYQLHNNVMENDSGDDRSFIGDTDVTGSWIEGMGSERHRHTTIRALYNDTNGDGNLLNDSTSAANYNNTNAYADAYGAGGETGTVDTSGRNNWSRDASGNRGQGTASTIWFNPTAQVGNLAAADSDVVLAHEMQHALHENQGTMATGTYAGAGPDGGNIANFERQAVGLNYQGGSAKDPQICPENTYRAERNQLGDNYLQRQNYSGTLPGRSP